jgi:Zn-dependent protease
VFLAILALAIAGGVITVFSDAVPQGPFFVEPDVAANAGVFLLVLAGWGVSLCLHEFGHAWVAFKGGDREVYFKGYLTLDPRKYTDPVFSLVLPLLILAVGGIPLPGGAVWINHHALRNKRTESMVSLAGPFFNLLLGVLLMLSVSLFNPTFWLASALSYLALLQIFAFVLNILPIPGLDGWGAIEPWLSPQAQRFGAKARPWAPLILFVAILAIDPVSQAFSDISFNLFDAVGGNEFFASAGNYAFMFWKH